MSEPNGEWKRRRRILDDSDRSIRRWAERAEKGVDLFASLRLLNTLNDLELAAAFSEQVHESAPDGFVKKFHHIRSLLIKKPLHEAKPGRSPSIDVLFKLVDSLFLETSINFMARAKFLSEDRPDMHNCIEAWYFARTRDLLEPPLGSGEQFRQLFIDRFERFSKDLIQPSLGITVPECLQALDTIDALLAERLLTSIKTRNAANEEITSIHRELTEGRISFETAIASARALPSLARANEADGQRFIFSLTRLSERSGIPRLGLERFLERASVVPGKTNTDYLLPTDKSHDALFLRMDEGKFYILDAISLYRDFFSFAQGLLSEASPATSQRYYNRRGSVVPRNVARELSRIFGDDHVHESLHYPISENLADWGEADILVQHRDAILLCEVKGREIKRAIDASIGPDRMWRDFSTIQEGFEQCARSRQYITNASQADFFDSSHRVRRLSIEKPVSEFFYLVVTANSFGCLAGNCSELLQTDNEPLPVVMSEFEITTFLAHVESPEMLLRYLRQRVALHGFLKTSDELEVAGVFVTQGSLDELAEMSTKADMLHLAPDTSFVFNGPSWSRSPEIKKAMDARRLTATVFSAETLGLKDGG